VTGTNRMPVAAAIALGAALFVLVVQAWTQNASQKTPDAPVSKAPIEQPVPFSHKQHIGFDMKCSACHSNPEPGDRMTFPSSEKCMECHRTVAKDKPAIRRLAEFAKRTQPVPWVRVYVVSAWVFWNHRSHLEAGMKCEACHGEVEKMEVLTAATDVTTMAGCVNCHKRNNASSGCQFCHSGR